MNRVLGVAFLTFLSVQSSTAIAANEVYKYIGTDGQVSYQQWPTTNAATSMPSINVIAAPPSKYLRSKAQRGEAKRKLNGLNPSTPFLMPRTPAVHNGQSLQNNKVHLCKPLIRKVALSGLLALNEKNFFFNYIRNWPNTVARHDTLAALSYNQGPL
jgi:hypothetical protein